MERCSRYEVPPDFIGRRFARWTVTAYVGVRGKERVWTMLCDCGNEGWGTTRALQTGRTKSCGCLAIEVRRANGLARRKHGLKQTPEYRAWCGMITRCGNPRCHAWKDYGGRGITVCAAWRESFVTFLADVGQRPSPQHSIDRRDNNVGYSPGNVRWATWIEQANNKRGLRYVEVKDECLTVAQAARRAGIHYNTLIGRLNRGQSVAQAITP